MTEWREVPEITEEMKGWQFCFGSLKKKTKIVSVDPLSGSVTLKKSREPSFVADIKGPWLVKPPEQGNKDPEKDISQCPPDVDCFCHEEKPKPEVSDETPISKKSEPWGFFWIREIHDNGWGFWKLYGPMKEPSRVVKFMPAKPDKDGKFYPPEEK